MDDVITCEYCIRVTVFGLLYSGSRSETINEKPYTPECMNDGREFRQEVLVKVTEEICFFQPRLLDHCHFFLQQGICNCECSKAFSLAGNYTDTITTDIYSFTIARKLLKRKV